MSRWTEKELSILRQRYKNTSPDHIAAELGRSKKAIIQKAHQLRLGNGKWSKKEDNLISLLYPHMTASEIAALIGRTVMAVKWRAIYHHNIKKRQKETTMSSRKSIYLSDAAEVALGPVVEDDSLSGRLNSILIRYDQIRIDACPELTVNEWCAICDANNGTWLQAESGENDPARHLWMNVADSDELDEKWSIDRLDLARRMKAMTIAEQCAVIEVGGRFWRTDAAEGETYSDMLRKCGANISE